MALADLNVELIGANPPLSWASSSFKSIQSIKGEREGRERGRGVRGGMRGERRDVKL